LVNSFTKILGRVSLSSPKINLNLTNDEIVQHLRNSFLKNKSNINFKNISIDNKK